MQLHARRHLSPTPLAGTAVLLSSDPYLDAALLSPSIPLRRLAVEQYLAILLMPGAEVPAGLRHQAVTRLLQAMKVKSPRGD